MNIFTTWGPVHGGCDHAHRNWIAALRCQWRYADACRSQVGHSDREVRIVDARVGIRNYDTIFGPGRALSVDEELLATRFAELKER